MEDKVKTALTELFNRTEGCHEQSCGVCFMTANSMLIVCKALKASDDDIKHCIPAVFRNHLRL